MSGDTDLSDNINEVCRLCLKCEGTILPIFGLEHSSRDCIPLSNKIKACVSVEVNKNDNLPKKICVGCVHQVDSWHRFKTICDTSQSKLKSWIKTSLSRGQHAIQAEVKQEVVEIEIDDNDDDLAMIESFDNSLPGCTVIDIDEDDDIDREEDPISCASVEDGDDDEDDVIEDIDCVDKNDVSNESANIVNGAVGGRVDDVAENSSKAQSGSAAPPQTAKKVVPEKSRKETEDSGFISDDIMLADFRDEIASNFDLNGENSCQSSEKLEETNEVGEFCIRVPEEEKRKDDLDEVVLNGDVDRDSGGISDREDDDKRSVSSDNSSPPARMSLRPRVRKSLAENDSTTSESGLLIVEGFSLSEYNSNSQDNAMVQAAHNHINHQTSSEPDIELIEATPNSSTMNDVDELNLLNIKPEPLSPVPVDPMDFAIKGEPEPEDWTLITPEAIDIKPDITLLERMNDVDIIHGGKRVTSFDSNRIPCEPCKTSFPTFVKWMRHTKSYKHQKNVAFFDNRNRQQVHHNEEVSNDEIIRSRMDSLIALKETKPNPCPIEDCHSSFKHRRNLLSHVKSIHGIRLKDIEATFGPRHSQSASSSSVQEIETTFSSRHSESAPSSSLQQDQPAVTLEPLNEGKEKEPEPVPPADNIFMCHICKKQFGIRRSLTNHLIYQHNIQPPRLPNALNLKCERCKKPFQKKTGLMSHMRTCGKYVKSRRCPYCCRMNDTYRDMVQHKAVCPKRPPRPSLIPVTEKVVVEQKDEEGSFTCEHCNITFQLLSIYNNHMKMYHNEDVPQEENKDVQNTTEDKVGEQNTVGELQEEPKNPVQPDIKENECTYCDSTFDSIDELESHIEHHEVTRAFRCKICHINLTGKRYYQDHMRSHYISHKGQFLCWTCLKPFNNRKDLNAHKIVHLKLKIYSCNLCKHSFASIMGLTNHKKMYHPNNKTEAVDTEPLETSAAPNPEELVCSVCSKVFSCQESLEKHSKLHNPVKKEIMMNIPQVCNKLNKAESRHPMNNVTKRIRCEQCHTRFSSRVNLIKHIKLNRCPLYRAQGAGKLRQVRCKFCRKQCSSVTGLYKHMEICKTFYKKDSESSDLKQCNNCNKSFSSYTVLFNHEKHCGVEVKENDEDMKKEDERPTRHVCQDCGRVYYSEESLRRHIKYCSKEPSDEVRVEDGDDLEDLVQCMNCNRRFTSDMNLKLHKRFCTTEKVKLIQCEHCNSSFTSKERFQLHEEACIGSKTPSVILSRPSNIQPCQSCGRIFTNPAVLAEHQESCSQQQYEVSSATSSTSSISSSQNKLLTCEYCHKRFSKYQQRNSHLRVCQVKLGVKKASPQKTVPPPAPVQSFSCVVCKMTFTSEEGLIEHSCQTYTSALLTPQVEIRECSVPIHKPKKVAKCGPCNKVFSGFAALNKHKQVFHGQTTATYVLNDDGTYQCPKCPRKFQDHKSLTHHMGWHTRGKVAETYSSLEIPITPAPSSSAPETPVREGHLACPICNRKFSSRGPMQNHIRSHSYVQNTFTPIDFSLLPDSKKAKLSKTVFRCKYCPKMFKDKMALIQHHNLHKSAFSSGNAMSGKVLNSPGGGGKTYVSCNICHKILSSNSIPKHKKLHQIRQDVPIPLPRTQQPSSQPTLYPCGQCYKLFRQQKSLDEHMVSEHGEYPEEFFEQDIEEEVNTEEDDEVMVLDDDDDENDEKQPMHEPQHFLHQEMEVEPEGNYRCEICNKSWKHKSVYLRHVNAVSHKEMTKRLSDILSRVNHDVTEIS